MKSLVYGHYIPAPEKAKGIEDLDWNKQWDIKTSTGATYVNMTITRIEGTDLYLRTPEVSGYGQLLKVRTMVIDICIIQAIEESPSRNVYLYCNRSPVLLWDLVYLSPLEKENIPTDSFDSMLDNLTRGTDTVVRLCGNGVYLYMKCDDSGRCHMSIRNSDYLVFVHRS